MSDVLIFADWRDLAFHLHAKICGKCKVKGAICSCCYQTLNIKRLVDKDMKKEAH